MPVMINTPSSLGSTLSGLNRLLGPQQGGSGLSKANQLVQQALDNTDRNPGFTRFDTPKAAALLNDKMASSVAGVLGANAPQSLAGQGADFSPEKVAQNILSFIDTAIGFARANGDDPAAIEKKMADVQAAVEKGFAEAKDILQSLGAWDGTVKDNAEKTLDLIHKGLDSRAAGGAQQPLPTQAAGGIATANLAAVDTQRAETFEMEIKTREGDIVKLTYSVNQSAGFKASRIADDSGVKQELSAYSSKSENLSFSVQGDLNDDEKKAIANLMKDVDKLATDFYGGDMQGAMQHAMALDMNKAQLSSLSLNLSYTQSRSAISAYQQVGALDQSRPGSAPLNNREAGTIGNFNKSLEGMLREADRFFRDAEKMVKKLFHDLAPETTNDKLDGSKKSTLSDMLQGMLAAAASRNEQIKAAAATPEI
jgi:hypothetical protein